MYAKRAEGIYLNIDRDGWTKGLQLSIDQVDADGGGHGYRIAGPKFNGSSQSLLSHRLDERDIAEMQRYLDKAKAMLAAKTPA